MSVRSVCQRFFLVTLLIILCLLLPAGSPPAVAQQPQAALEQVPRGSSVMFIENVGQFADGARFQVRDEAGTMWLAEDAIWVTVLEPSADSLARPDPLSIRNPQSAIQNRQGVNLRISFPGANPHPRLEPFDRLDTVVSYFLGNDPAQWRPDVPVWGGVRYVDLYPGVDLELTGEGGRMVQRLTARPGADLNRVHLRVEGADAVTLDGDALRLSTAAGEVTLPLLLAEGSSGEAVVQSRAVQAFDIATPFIPSHRDRQPVNATPQSTVDNPADLLYGTFLGGSSDDWGTGIAVDGAGSAYVTGDTYSSNFPTTPGAFDTGYSGGYDAFVVKLNPTGSGLAYAAFLGGSGDDRGYDIVVDRAGSAHVTGVTRSVDFPITLGAFDTSYNGTDDAFVVKLNLAGSALVYATFLGGQDIDCNQRCAITVDYNDSAFVTGDTASYDFPVTSGAYDPTKNGGNDVFVAHLKPDGSGLVYATFLGGYAVDAGYAIAVENDGSAYVTGDTYSDDFPTTPNAYDQSYNGTHWFPMHGDAFVAKLSPNGTSLTFATFLGGSSEDMGSAIAVDEMGEATVAGYTEGAGFPVTPGAFDTSFGGGGDFFVARLNEQGSELVWATFLGGSNWEDSWYGPSVMLDANGMVYVAGATMSSDAPTTPEAYDTSFSGGVDLLLAKLTPDGAGLSYATYLGSSGFEAEWGCSLAVGDNSSVYVASDTLNPPDFPVTPGAYDTSPNGGYDAFVVKLAMEGGAAYTISGRVTDGNNNGIPGVTVSALLFILPLQQSLASHPSAVSPDQDYSVMTDSNGDYSLIGLPAGGDIGYVMVTPAKSGYAFTPASRTVKVPPDATGQDFTARRLPADPTQSTINAQPASVPADGTSTITVTVQLHSADGQPAWGKTVRLSSSRGVLDDIVQPAVATDSNGDTTGFIRSSTAGTATVSAFVYDDGVSLADAVSVTFEPYTPPSGSFLFRLNQLVDTATDSLNQINDDAQAIADDGNYFRGAIGADAARLAADVVFGMADVIGGVNQTWQLQKAARLACPGCYVPGTWNVEFSYNYPAATRLLDIGFMRLEDAPASQIAEFIGWGGPQFYGKVLNAGASYVTKEVAKNATRTIFASMNDGMTSVAYPAVRDTDDELTALLDIQRDNLLANLPAMTPAYQSAHEGDLTGRTLALLTLGQQLDDERMTLANFRQVQGQQPNALLNFLLRFTAKGLATGFFDGPGTLAVGGTLTLFDGYMDGKRLSESIQMYDLATGALLGAPDALRQTYRVANKAMDRIATGQPADRATGQITGVTHYNAGSGWGPFWHESASWSEVSLINTSASEATFRVLVSYLADTTRFGLPWATMNLVEESTITLAPGTNGTVRVDYKRANGTKGFSPRSETCFPGAGCVPASDINVQVLGTNEAGTYYIGNDLSVWQPTRVNLTGVSLAGLADDLPVIDPPLTSYVLSAPWTQKHEAQLWINNPFTSTISVTVTQALPAGIILLDAGGAGQDGNVLTWNTTVESSALKLVTFTFSYPAAPGTVNSLSPANLSLISPLDGQSLAADSNAVDFQAIWPLALDYATPGYVLPGSSPTVLVTVTNWLSSNEVTGTLAISVTGALSTTVYTDSQPFRVPISTTSAVSFTLPATLAPGDYQVVGAVATGGATAAAFTDLLQVGLPGPWLDYRASPAGPVHANETITYTVRFTNTTGVSLTSAVVTASLPTSVTVVVGSITGGGVEEVGWVRWTLGAIAADQAIEQRFAVRVNPDAVPASGEPGRLLSEPLLTADEIAPTWGPLAWNLAVLPAVAPMVTVGRSDDSVVLTWTHNPVNIGGYEVWWSTAPYFTPGDPGTDHETVQSAEGSVSYTHTNGGGGVNYFYVVLGADGAKAKSAASNRVGAFSFALTPGGD